jgi:hypothetical protein
MEYFLLINFAVVIIVSYYIGRWNGYRIKREESKDMLPTMFHPDQME